MRSISPFLRGGEVGTRRSVVERFLVRFSIRLRLAAAFSALILLLVLTAAVGVWGLASLDAATTKIATVDIRLLRLVSDWFAETKSNVVRAVVLTHSDDPDFKRILIPQMEASSNLISTMQKQVEQSMHAADAQAMLKDIAVKRKTYIDARTLIIEHRKAGRDYDAGKLVDSALMPAIAAYLDSIHKLQAYAEADFSKSAAATTAIATSGRDILMLVCAFGVLMAALSSWLIAASITGPISSAVAVAERVAAGDLTDRVEASGKDEAGKLLGALSRMTLNLRQLVGEVADGAHVVSRTSAQIAQGNQDLSQRTEMQAGTLEETASSLEELTSTVTQNAHSAQQASQLASGAAEIARTGGQVVSEVVSTMTDISESSKKISDIIGVIDAIAFQTNILALNAAVEAARAGDQGRGFAVVAAEVRNLAQRSATAAKEIKGLIGDSVGKVQAGTRLVDRAGKTMDEIVGSVNKVNDLIGEIAAASREQSSGIEQVNVAVTQMDQVVQQNASLVEEAAIATASMEAQAAALLRTVARFELGTHESVTAPAAAPRAIHRSETAIAAASVAIGMRRGLDAIGAH
ncbi:MAG: methyl-accepting chemotaxis protein [Ramlibacter sp.]